MLILPAIFRLSFRHFCLHSSSISAVDLTPRKFRLKSNCKPRPVHFEKKKTLRLSSFLRTMANPEYEKILAPLRADVKEYGDLIRRMKEMKTPKIDIDKAVVELKARKKRLEDKELSFAPKDASFDRFKLEDLLKRRFFYDQSFSIYGGIAGLYDFGPMGCAMKSNMIQEWRKHFVLEEGMSEVDCSILTPEYVLRASGHVERFADYMVKDLQTGECFRADHLIKNQAEKLIDDSKSGPEKRAKLTDVLAKLDGFNKEDLEKTIAEFNFKSPITNNDLSGPIPFNLMFTTQIGPTGSVQGFLRPETAQGIFTNFKRLLEFNQDRLPFAAAQIGPAFRNEISPRSGLLRVREFTMCEIEHFVDPDDKTHSKFDKVRDHELTFLSASNQMDGIAAEKMTIGKAVSTKMVDNETLGYYLVRVHEYLLKIGVDDSKLRFRQHLSNEMAHYATDCWDAECLTSYGWVECVGNADRSCYDLQQHYRATGVKLVAEIPLEHPVLVDVIEAVPNKALIGPKFKRDASLLIVHLEQLDADDVIDLETKLNDTRKATLTIDNKSFEVLPEMLTVKRYKKQKHVQETTPSVIEPSFGIGRILYTVLEHRFRMREEDEQRTFLDLPPLIAPVKCSVLPLSGNPQFDPIVALVARELLNADLSHKIDDGSGSIGRRYARTDEIGIPFGITVDFDSLKMPYSVTLRHALTRQQIRMPLADVGEMVSNLVKGKLSWVDILSKYPIFEQQVDQ